MKKRILSMLLVAVMCMALSACGGKEINITENESAQYATEEVVKVYEIDAENLAFQDISKEECEKIWNGIKISMSDIAKVHWEFDFWDKGFYKDIPVEGRYNICLYGMEDVNEHINEAALYLIATIPSAHNNDDVISDIQNYRKKQIESHNGMESKLTNACDSVIEILQQADGKKEWNISNSFWVRKDNEIFDATFEGYAYLAHYEVPNTNNYILSLDILNDSYVEQKVLGLFDFEAGRVNILEKTKEKELISALDASIFSKHNIAMDDVSLVYWYDSGIEWVSESVFEFSYMPDICNCNRQCILSFKYDFENDKLSDVSLTLNDCSITL